MKTELHKKICFKTEKTEAAKKPELDNVLHKNKLYLQWPRDQHRQCKQVLLQNLRQNVSKIFPLECPGDLLEKERAYRQKVLTMLYVKIKMQQNSKKKKKYKKSAALY